MHCERRASALSDPVARLCSQRCGIAPWRWSIPIGVDCSDLRLEAGFSHMRRSVYKVIAVFLLFCIVVAWVLLVREFPNQWISLSAFCALLVFAGVMSLRGTYQVTEYHRAWRSESGEWEDESEGSTKCKMRGMKKAEPGATDNLDGA